MSRPDKSEITQRFLRGGNCAQAVFGAFSDETGYDGDETDKIAAAFGGGMMMGQTCGAVTGGLMAIGLMSDTEEEAAERAIAFETKFNEKYGSCMCRDLIKYDVSIPEELNKARESGIMIDLCPCIVDEAIKMIDEIINE